MRTCGPRSPDVRSPRARPVRTWPPRTPAVPSAASALRRRRRIAWPAISLLAAFNLYGMLALSLLPLRASAGSPDDALSGALYLHPDGADGFQSTLRLHSDIRVQVTGLIARVEIVQRFENASSEWAEGLYVLPLPENAAVDTLRMDVGGRVTVGEIREKIAAQQLYARAKAQGQRASLVEQRRANLFRTRVANIGPGETIEVAIGYLQIIDQQGGEYRLRVPLAITRRYLPGQRGGDAAPRTDIGPPYTDSGATAEYPAAQEDADLNPPFAPPDAASNSVSLSVDLDAGTAVAHLVSAFHAIDTRDLGGRYDIHLKDDHAAPDRDFELSWRPQIGAEPVPVVFTETQAGMTHALLMIMPPYSATPRHARRELTFVIDTSGSMYGASLAQAKAALLQGFTSLAASDTFNVIQFNSTTESLFAEPVNASAANKEIAREYIAALRSDGGTEMAPALRAALRGPAMPGVLQQIVFITDGAVGNEEALFEQITQSIGDARLFTVGIGSAPNGYFMRAAARAGRGTYTFIGSQQQVHARIAELLEKIESPVVTDIALTWPGDVSAETSPSTVPDLYMGEPLVVTVRFDSEPSGLIQISGRTGDGIWVRQVPLSTHRIERPGIARAWARMRIGELLDERRTGRSEDSIRSQVLDLALAYQLVSRYTSLVAISPEVVRPRHASLKTAAVPASRPHGSADGDLVLDGMPQTATFAPLHLLLGVLALVLASLSWAVSPRRDFT
jgi:Ca-activated chloride channel homolog